MNDKPIIRHCRNCKYATLKQHQLRYDTIYCGVRYEFYAREEQRKAAIFCRHYKRMQPTPEFLTKRVNIPMKQKAVEEDDE